MAMITPTIVEYAYCSMNYHKKEIASLIIDDERGTGG
jgi:hypothetical protein